MNTFHPSVRLIGLAAVLLILGGCASPEPKRAAEPPPEPPLGAAKVTPSSAPALMPALDQVPHLAFNGVSQQARPTPLWSVKLTPPHGTFGKPLVSPDGRWLTIAQESKIQLFDLRERTIVATATIPGALVRLFFDQTGTGLIGLFNSAERPSGSFKQGCSTLGFWTLPGLEFTSRPLQPDYVPATNAALTHAGDRMLVFGIDRSIGVFDVATGRQLLRFDRHMGEKPGAYVTHGLGGIAISQDDRLVTSYSSGPHPNGRLRRWSLADGQEIPTGPEGYDYNRNGAPRMTFTADNRFVFKSGGNSGLRLDRAEDGHGLYFYNTWGYQYYDARQPRAAITSGDSGRFGVIDVLSGQLRFEAGHEVEPPAQYPTTRWAILSPDGRTVYTANYGHILAWDFAGAPAPDQLLAGKSWTMFLAHQGSRLQSLETSPGPKLFSRVIEWDVPSRTFITSARSLPYAPEELLDAKGNTLRWTMGRFSLDGRIVTISGGPRLAKFFEPISGRTLFEVGAPGTDPDPAAPPDLPDIFGRHPLAAAASPDGRLLALGSTKGRALTLWDLRAGRYVATLEGHSRGVTSVQYSPDGRRLISGDEHGTVLIRARPLPPAAPDQPAAATKPARKSRRAAPVPPPPETPAPPPVPEWLTLGHATASRVTHTCTNSDGTLLAVAHANGSVTAWQDTRQGEWCQLFMSKLPRAPGRIALSPSGRLLAVAQFDSTGLYDPSGDRFGNVLVLDARTGTLRLVLDGVDARDLVFLDDHHLATAGNGTHIWTLPETGGRPE
jgi:WD40 repeat protein